MRETLAKGLVGTITPVIGVITSFQEQLEFWLRFAGLVVGLAVGVCTLYSLVRGMVRGKN